MVPIFNVEQWLPAFLDTVLAQTFTDWEAILVVDGSPDGSLLIAKNYARQDDRFVVLDCVQGGVGRARNRGLALARGEYLAFADPDDLLHPDAYAVLMRSLIASGSDIAIGRGEHFTEDGVHSTYWTQRSPVFAAGGVGLTLDDSPDLILDHAPWTKVLRASLFHPGGLRFPEGTLCEDLVFSAEAFSAARAIDVVPETVYHHRERGGAITSDLMIDPILNDWMTQAAAAASVVDTLSDASRNAHYRRLLNREVWTRVRALDRVVDADALARFEHFIADMLRAASPEVRDSLPHLKRSLLQLLGSGRLRIRWPEHEVPNPVADGLSNDDRARRAVTAAARLSLDDSDEIALRSALLRKYLFQPLLGYQGGLADIEFAEACRLIHTVFEHDLVDPETSGLSPSELLLVTAARAHDEKGFRFIVDSELVSAEATASRLSITSSGLRVDGRLTLASSIALSANPQLVLRSRSSDKVRAFAAIIVPHTADQSDHGWEATMQLSQKEVGEDWSMWLRLERPGLGRREIVLTLPAEPPASATPIACGDVSAVLRDETRAVLVLTAHEPPARSAGVRARRFLSSLATRKGSAGT